MERDIRLAVFGTDDAPPAPRRLVAGPLSADIVEGAVRSLRWHGVEVLRGIDYPVRDADWGTVPAATDAERFEETAVGFAYERRFRAGDDRLTGVFACTGSADGTVELRLVLTADHAAEVNRAGFVVLHPVAGVAGSPLRVVHGDGTIEETRFPEFIAPSQPVFDIAALRQTANGVTADIAFAGEVFEMEDQRNWSDASYKTYCRPLSLPYPYTLAAGAVVEQRITLTLAGQAAAPAANAADALVPGSRTGRKLPELALALEPGWESDSAAILALEPAATLLRLDLTDPDWSLALPALVAAAPGALDLELVVADVVAGIDPQLAFLHDLLSQSGIVPRSVTALPCAYLQSYQPDAPWPAGATPEQTAAMARERFPAAAIGGGMLTNFTELNRYRAAAVAGDFVTHGTTAIVHAADDLSVLQTLEALPQILASAEALAPGKPYRLGLVSIGMRSNPYGAAVATNPDLVRRPMAMADPRHRGLFGAAWMLGAVAATAASRVERLALAAPAGPFGLVAGGRLVPAYHVIAGLGCLEGRDRLAVATPAGIAAVAAATPQGTAMIVANLTPDRRTVALPGTARFVTLEGAPQDLDWLGTASRQSGADFVLGPHAVAFASLGSGDVFGPVS